MLMVIDSVPTERRGYYGSLVQLGYPVGVISSTGVFALASKLPEAELLTWGWRVPFLLSTILVGIGLFIRLRLAETPVFRQVQAGHEVAKIPLLEILTKHRRTFLVAVGLKLSEIAYVSVATVFSITYVTEYLGMPRSAILNGILLLPSSRCSQFPLSVGSQTFTGASHCSSWAASFRFYSPSPCSGSFKPIILRSSQLRLLWRSVSGKA
jgi:MHS family shikimate/dehydroshikimate transporter-like MFS transporter